MNIGMLWFDNDPKDGLSAKIERAAAYYQNKYGRTPTLCFVHPSMLATAPASQNTGAPGESIKSAGIEVRPTRSVLPNHFWIGVNGTANSAPAGS
jgi:hypothetical protein